MTDTVWFRFACIAVAGAIGSICRWSLIGGVNRLGTPPWGTLVVNVLGCFFFGFVYQVMAGRVAEDSYLRLVAFTGFAGAFTTYSTFAFETHKVSTTAGFAWGGLNIILHLTLSWAALVAGLGAGKAIT